MTVAATILADTAESALADTLGQPRVRRLVDIAWAGGALPVVVVSPDPDGTVARALTGSEAIHGGHAPESNGAAGQMARGVEVAMADVRDTTAVLVWPVLMTWVGPETVTSLIETHGVDPETILRPAWEGEAGWPVLVPVSRLDGLHAVAPGGSPADAIASLAAAFPSRLVDLGDPGVAYDADTPHAALPPYEGPPEPPAGHTHEWGADVEAEAGLAGPGGGA